MNYKNLADYSRVWVYQSDRKLNDSEVREIKIHGNNFIEDWAAHGSDLQAAFEVFYNHFIVLFADESQVKASGCSIDSSVRFIKGIEQAYKLDLFNRLNIAFKKGNIINMLPMSEFSAALKNGELNENTIVFNNLVETKSDFETKWEVAIKDSWHSTLL